MTMQHSHNEVINIIERLLRFLDVNNICKKDLTPITSSEQGELWELSEYTPHPSNFYF